MDENQNQGQQTPQYPQQQNNFAPPPPPPVQGPKDRKTMAIIGMICGIVSIVFFCVSYISIAAGIVGIVLGVMSLKSSGRGMAIAGIICGALGLVITIVFLILVVAIGVNAEILNNMYPY